MSKRRSKAQRASHRTGARFAPNLVHLEDRAVPATFFVDPTFAQPTPPADGTLVTFNAGYPGSVGGLKYASSVASFQADNTRTAFSDLRTAIDAAEANPGPDTIRIARTTTSIPLNNALATPLTANEDSAIRITQPLDLVGSGIGATVITPTNDTQFVDNTLTPAPDSLTSVFRATADLTVTDLTFDGTGKQLGVGFLVRDGATGTFNRVDVRNVAFDTPTDPNEGFGIVGFNGSTLNISDSRVEGSGRVGIQYADSSGTTSNTVVTGRGFGNFVNTGIDIIGNSTVVITGSTITDNAGRSGGFASAGVQVSEDTTTTFAPTVALLGNQISANGVGVGVGVSPGDTSTVSAQFNNIVDNDVGLEATNAVNTIQAPNNWWGPGGPFEATQNPAGTGNPVVGAVVGGNFNINFQPFLNSKTPVVAATSVADYQNKITVIGVAVAPLAGQPNPVPSGPVQFTVTFAQPVTGFDASDVTVVGFPAGSTPTVTVTGTGANYTVTVNGLTGNGPVSVQVNPGAAMTADGFLTAGSGVASVNFGTGSTNPNTPPTISAVPSQTVANGAATPALPFTVGDAETPAGSLIVTASSSNPALVPNGNIVLGGSGANRTVTVTPVAGQSGAATITLTVTDGSGATASTAFVVTAQAPVNTAPTITPTPLPDQTVPAGTTVGPITFTVGDNQTPAGQLVVTATSSNQTLLPNGSIVIGGSGADRTISFTPAADQSGTATITVTVTDAGGLTATSTLALTVTPALRPGLQGTPTFAVGTDVGGGPVVNYYNPDGTLRTTVSAFASSFRGGVRTAVRDFNGDGVGDIVVGTGPGIATQVRILDGKDGHELFSINPFEATFTGGVFVAAGDVNGDGTPDLVITPDQGGGPRARVFSGKGFSQIIDFFAIQDPAFRGGARPAVGDVNGDGAGDLVVSAGFLGGPRVAGFDGKSLSTGNPVKLFADFFAFESTLRNGAFLAVGDVNGDGFADIVAGGGPGGGPRVLVLNGHDLTTSNALNPVANFFAGDTSNRGGIRVAVKDLDNDNLADIVTGAGTGAGSRVTGYTGKVLTSGDTTPTFAFDAFPGFTGGVFVG